MIVMHDYRFNMDDHKGCRDFVSFLNFGAHAISRNTLKSNVLWLYNKEMKNLISYLAFFSGKISLTSNLWSSIATDEYTVIKVNYIDRE